MKKELINRVNGVINKSNEFKKSFDNYAYLWHDDRKEFMRQFLLYNHVLTQEEIENYDLTESPPTLDQFKAQVNLLNFCFLKNEVKILYYLIRLINMRTLMKQY